MIWAAGGMRGKQRVVIVVNDSVGYIWECAMPERKRRIWSTERTDLSILLEIIERGVRKVAGGASWTA